VYIIIIFTQNVSPGITKKYRKRQAGETANPGDQQPKTSRVTKLN